MSSHARDEQGHNLHFFKVILESNIRDGELRVPKGFVKRYWQEISNPVFLRLPNGFERRVDWIKKDGDVWFSNGWKEFAQYLSLEVSQFLVFRYEGKSRFHVIIFGKSAIEIKYPLTEGGEEVNDDESDYSLTIVDDFDKIKHKRPKSTNPSSQARKKMKTIPKKEEPECYYSHTKTTKHDEKKKKAHDASFGNGKSGDSNDNLEERIKAFHKKVNQNFSSENHWFTRAMKKTYTERDLLVMQNKFAKTILKMREGEATLSLTKDMERTWDVMIKRYCCDKQLAFVAGWIKFVEDNNLKIGDVCAFVMNKCKGFSFNVVIFPFEDDSSIAHFAEQKRLCHRPSSCLKDPETPKANSRAFFTNHFTMDIKENSHVTIPMSFMRNYATLGGKIVTLQVGKRTWNVRLRYYPTSSYARFSDGWHVFIRECDLKAGDSCRIEMVDEENCLLNVSITKRTTNLIRA
ncbi:hypothetical protein RIF29_36065 [Crotalaria pallida]|uniref:TF-B3 domain-containing protein n=1 Tax=Crotalaria pallida TaxID=3830 RepID=A0AAN9HVJ0_CROPI